jgi:hypothetical protein
VEESPLAEDVRIETCDGVRLHATLYPSPKDQVTEQGPCVLMVPDVGMAGSRTDAAWVRLAKRLQKDGCAVLTFDFRGCGENRSSGQLANRFWEYQANKTVLLPRMKKGAELPTSLDANLFPPTYLPWLLQDIVAARNFVDIQHEEGRLNSHNLVVITAGKGAMLTAFWFAAEHHRYKTRFGFLTGAGEAESRDIMAAVWIDSHRTVGQQSIPPAASKGLTTFFAREMALPWMLFLYDKKTTGAAARSKGMMKLFKQEAESEKAIGGTGKVGQAVLGEPEGEKAVVEFLAMVRKTHKMRTWARRTSTGSGFIWTLGGSSTQAKKLSEKVPQPLPMDLLGFRQLTARFPEP